MKIEALSGNIVDSKADTLIVNLFAGGNPPGGASAAVDRALDGAISELIANGDLSGKLGEVGVVYPRGAIPARRVLITGLGEAQNFDLEAARQASAHAVKKARELNARQIASLVHGAGINATDPADAAQAVAEGSLLALYKAPKKNQPPWDVIESLTLVESDHEKRSAVEQGAKIGASTGAAAVLVRDLVSLGPNLATPTDLAELAGQIASQYGMRLTVGDRAWAAERKMGAFLGVAQGAKEPPRFIVIEHRPDRPDLETIVLVGKGITFDSGGISLKSPEKMSDMKSDMAGAAVVIAAMQVVGQLDLPLHVVAIAPCTENMPAGDAIRPADILTASNGKTIEIISTDAEGRLILADALVYAQQFKPSAVIDLATLTGACVVALGSWVAAGLFCTDDWLRDGLVRSGKRMHELVWPMPLFDEYKKKIKSLVADMANSGGRNGGVGSSAIFLKEFIDYPWAHIDMAGMVLIEKALETPYTPFGATGYGLRLVTDFLLSRCKASSEN